MIDGYAMVLASKLREIRNYKKERASKYLNKFSSLDIVSDEDINTLSYILDTANIPCNSEQEKTYTKLYAKFLVDAAFYGYNVDATYWAYYNLLHRD